jgi:hypothetical protein
VVKKADVSEIAAALGSLGGKVKGPSKRRDVDYAALGRLGGAAGKGKKKPRRKRGHPPSKGDKRKGKGSK